MDAENSKLVYRKDVLKFILDNIHLPNDVLFNMIIKGKDNNNNLSAQGFSYETIIEILLVTKCIDGLNYTSIYEGQLNNLKIIKNIKKLLDRKILGQGGNKVDISIQYLDTIIPISIKYRKNFGETDVCKIDKSAMNNNLNYKIGLIVKDKNLYLKHRYINDDDEDKKAIDTINSNKLLFDETDIMKGLKSFCTIFQDSEKDVDTFIDFINAEYLFSPRVHLKKRLHQRMQELQYARAGNNNTCNSHKPRSGKTIETLLNIQTDLNEGCEKTLLITPVPSTIPNYTYELDKYIEFKNICYVTQDEFHKLNDSFKGIALCSLQYLKTDSKSNKKVDLLKKIKFDRLHVDECHIGAATDKTNKDILSYDTINDINNNNKNNFISGTADKTIKYYNVQKSRISLWDIEDEAYMKLLGNPNLDTEEKNSIIRYMVNRHGEVFLECYLDETLDKNYSMCPIQVLMQPTIPASLINQIKKYNSIHNTDYGFNFGSFTGAKQIIDEKGYPKYINEFQLCETNDGEDIVKAFFEFIISSDRMDDNSIMKKIEKEQSRRGSRKSSVEHPLLFILYLPTHTGNNTIANLQKTIKKFIEKHNLWSDYNVEYSNAIDDTGDVKEIYNEYIDSIMKRTKKDKKRGCILLLGDKGSVGVTYKDCDVTISLDDGTNLDRQKQRNYRSLTDAPGKTIGINVDLNIQRTYSYITNMIHQHRINTKTDKSNAEILFYLSKRNIFIFNPQEISSGSIKTTDILSYYNEICDNILNIIDDTPFLENIICDNNMRDFITSNLQRSSINNHNEDLEGLQQDCPKGGISKTFIDAPADFNQDKQKHNNEISSKEKKYIESYINQTYELCKNDMFPFLGMLSKLYKIRDFNESLVHPKTKWQVILFLLSKKVNTEKYDLIVSIMNTILYENQDIVNSIREIYSRASGDKLRLLVAKHFIPTNQEKVDNAEIPTPVFLVNALLDKLPPEIWTKPCKVFEPCCGKGNIILGIFDKFYNGLADAYPDTVERCKIIATECIYYADKTYLNVFITTALLKCHIQSYCGLDELDYEFNSYIGDSLALNIYDKWNIQYFDVVIGNYPYNNTGNIGTGNVLWPSFATKSISWTKPGGYVLAIHPPGWRKPNSERGKFTGLYELLAKDNQIVYLEIHGIKDGNKTFNCGTRYDWYLLEKTKSYKNSVIIDENNDEFNVDLSRFSWLPNSNILEISNILPNKSEDTCPIIYSRSAYGADKKERMSANEDEIFKYPCIHSTPQNGIRYMYSRENNRGHFGISKVIFGESGIYNPIIDMEGKFGMTHGAMAIQISNKEEGEKIVNAITSPKFKKFISSCMYSSFRIDWNIFKDLKREFYNEFI